MARLLIINVTYHTPQNRVSDTILHVTLNTINGEVVSYSIVSQAKPSKEKNNTKSSSNDGPTSILFCLDIYKLVKCT